MKEHFADSPLSPRLSALAVSPEVADSDPWEDTGRWDADSENGGPSQPDMSPGGAGEEHSEGEEL